MDQISFVHQPIHMIVEWNANKWHMVHKELGKMTKVSQGFRNKKKGWSETRFKKATENHQGVGFV